MKNDDNADKREDQDEENQDEACGSDVKVSGWSPSGKNKKSRYTCKGGFKQCGLKISPKEDSIMCDGCNAWFHPKCQALSNEKFKALSKFDFLWLCMDCKPKLMLMVNFKKDIEACIENTGKTILQALTDVKPKKDLEKEIEKKIVNMELKVVNQIKEQQVQVETSLQEQTKAVQATVQTLPKYTAELKSSAQDLKRMVENKAETEFREKNVLLHNIAESSSDNSEERKEHDLNIFQRVVTSLVGNQENMEVEKIFRLGKKPEQPGNQNAPAPKPRLMLIKLKNKEHVNMLMKRRTQLKDVGFPNVYLTKDLSPEEREAQKKLRQELEEKGKETHKIFRGKVLPRQ